MKQTEADSTCLNQQTNKQNEALSVCTESTIYMRALGLFLFQITTVAEWLSDSLTSRSCLLASSRSGTPSSAELLIILSGHTQNIINHWHRIHFPATFKFILLCYYVYIDSSLWLGCRWRLALSSILTCDLIVCTCHLVQIVAQMCLFRYVSGQAVTGVVWLVSICTCMCAYT